MQAKWGEIARMTTLGHTLVGASIGLICMPAGDKARHRLVLLACIIAVASLPDWPIPGWGHFRLDISHSIIVNCGLMLGITIIYRSLSGSTFRKYGFVLVGLLVAWMSHFLLDAFYADSRLAIFWPLSQASISLPIPWLKTMPHLPPPFDGRILQILLWEAATFLPLVFLATAIRIRGRAVDSNQ